MIYAILAITLIATAGQVLAGYFLFSFLERQQDKHVEQVNRLIQWVKDTPAASAQTVADASPHDTPLHVPIHDDDAYFKALDELGVTE